MRTLEGNTITLTDPHRHKFADAITEYIYESALSRGGFDNAIGSDDAPMGCVSLHGKRILFCDDQGFVSVDTYPSKESAEAVFDAISNHYYVWSDDEPEDVDEREILLQQAEAYTSYVVVCAVENLEAFGMNRWFDSGCPTGPIG